MGREARSSSGASCGGGGGGGKSNGDGGWGLKCVFLPIFVKKREKTRKNAHRGGFLTIFDPFLGIFFRPLVWRKSLFATPQTFMQVRFRVPVSSFRVWGGPHPNIYY